MGSVIVIAIAIVIVVVIMRVDESACLQSKVGRVLTARDETNSSALCSALHSAALRSAIHSTALYTAALNSAFKISHFFSVLLFICKECVFAE